MTDPTLSPTTPASRRPSDGASVKLDRSSSPKNASSPKQEQQDKKKAAGESFVRRMMRMFENWPEKQQAVALVAGEVSDDALEQKTLAMHQWLLGGELPETIMVIFGGDKDKRSLWILSDKKKADILEKLLTGVPLGDKFTIHYEVLDGASDVAVYDKVFGMAKAIAGEKKCQVGLLKKEKHVGKMAKGFTNYCSSNDTLAHDSIGNATATVSSWMMIKDAEEVENMRRSAIFSTLLMKQVMVRDVESVIEKDAKKSHEAICDTVESAAENKEMLTRWAKKFPYLAEDKAVDVVYTLIQSGKEFTLRPDVQPNREALDFSCIVVSVGAKYREYSTNITRTLIVDPTKHQRAYYNLCLSTMDTIIKSINGKESVTCQEVYNAAVEHIKQKASTVEYLHDALSQFQTDCGYSIGLEFRDGHMLLNAKNHKHITPGMCLNLGVGFAGDKMVNEKKKPYAVWVCDSAYISTGRDGKMKVELLTSGMSSGKDEVMYYLDTDQPGENEDVVKSERKDSTKKEKKSKKEKRQHDKTPDKSKREKERREEAKSSSGRHKHKKDDLVIESRLRTRRNRATAEDEEERKRLMEQQYELRARKVEECRARLLRSGEDAGDSDEDATNKNKCLDTCKSYATPDDIPRDIRTTKLTVDAKHDTLLVPINGNLVAFHIRTIKNVSKPNDEGGKYTSIRINFHAPGTSFVQQDMFPEANRSKETLVYLKELNYRAEDGRNLQAVFRGLKELQKRQRTRELEANTMKDIKEQPSLKLIKDRSRPVLRDLNVKPQLGSTGRNRAVGTLEAHQNGFRFTSSRAEHVDIIYRNIAHAIFQPCENDQTVLLHFNLKDPILVSGKKKTYDIQFYTETRSAGDDLGTRRRAGYDPDEIMDEQREREMITKLNKLFREFVRQVEEQVWSQYAPNLEFDMPYRELGFTGTPNKAHVDIYPCRDCIVALSEWPAYVLSLRNIDIVYFERVSFNLRNFDMTFIFKDYTQTPARISIIPTESLDQIKQWLGELGIVWYQGPTNMNWTNIMKEINKKKQAFIDNGAWEGWFGESVDEGSDDGMDEGDEEYTESEDSDVESEAGGSEYKGGGSDSDSGSSFLVDEESDSDSEVSLASDESEGLSWDELEKKAANEDRKRRRSPESSEKKRPVSKKKRR